MWNFPGPKFRIPSSFGAPPPSPRILSATENAGRRFGEFNSEGFLGILVDVIVVVGAEFPVCPGNIDRGIRDGNARPAFF